MAKSDLLKEAIADAKAVKETALANAKIALEEAFAPRIHGMLSAKLSEELDDEDMDEPTPEPTMEHDVMYEPEGEEGMGSEMDMEAPAPEMDTEIDMEAPAPEMEAPADDMSMEGMYINDEDEDPTDADSMMAPTDEDLELEAIIRELEEDLDEDLTEDVVEEDAHNTDAPDSTDSKGNDLMADASGMKNEEFNIDEIIEEILSEDDETVVEGEHEEDEKEEPKETMDEISTELDEAYNTIHSLKDTINEVNLLNAKLLYTNKLFRNFELSENQKMTVIENFDRAGNTREVKLVFSTLAESFQLPVKKKKIVKESFASKASGTTAPSNKTKQIINEGNQLANRWKKLAGLL
jgi:hypothetical protein